ncbi:hypothetical protein D3C72_752800 [compost metagenome]
MKRWGAESKSTDCSGAGTSAPRGGAAASASASARPSQFNPKRSVTMANLFLPRPPNGLGPLYRPNDRPGNGLWTRVGY